MRLARRALFAALATLVLLSAATAQTLRPGNDPRNQAPTVGTGGTPGGPTGLFTIYDGDTLRKGEFTFSVAYSNYDRDPGNVDFSVIPLSFNVGINDHLELWFSTEGYRGVKVNNPKHLSSFYLPNSQLFFGQTLLGSGPAIIIAPERVSGSTALTGFGTLFRPAFNQPFVQFPFVGGPGPNFGLTGNRIAVPFTSRLGVPTGQEQGNFTAASNFPGVGSPCGSILPGVVLTTRTIPANSTFNVLTVPDLATICPTYVADAPFVNRLYGESTFGTMQAGVKWRFTGPNNPLGVGVVAFYRWYLDKADDLSGFNQLQRGASPGGDIGDIGLVGFVSGRLSRSVSLHANLGYILNSNPQSEAFGTGKVSLLDRADELVSGVGMDFVVNRHFQIITELKSVQYVGGRTPNAFQQNPVDFLGGIRIFPRRWFGFSAAYRGNLNQQGRSFVDIFRDDEPNDGFPAGFRTSDDPHGFIFQFFAGHRYFDDGEQDVDFSVTQPEGRTVRIPHARECAECERRIPDCPKPATATTIELTSSIRDAKATTHNGRQIALTPDELSTDFDWRWEVVDGPAKIEPRFNTTGASSTATFDFASAPAGDYKIRASATYACAGASASGGCVRFGETTVTVERPEENCCEKISRPTVAVSCPDTVSEGQPATFTANVSGGSPGVTPSCSWDVPGVAADKITQGSDTCSITVDTTGLGGRTITATVNVTGYPTDCAPTSASCSVSFPPPMGECEAFDAYGDIRFNDEKARLDNFAIELQNRPQATGYYIYYNGPKRRSSPEGAARAERALNYLETYRQIDRRRVVVQDGGYRESCFAVVLLICDTGKTPKSFDQNDSRIRSKLDLVKCESGGGTRKPPVKYPRKRRRVVIGS